MIFVSSIGCTCFKIEMVFSIPQINIATLEKEISEKMKLLEEKLVAFCIMLSLLFLQCCVTLSITQWLLGVT